MVQQANQKNQSIVESNDESNDSALPALRVGVIIEGEKPNAVQQYLLQRLRSETAIELVVIVYCQLPDARPMYTRRALLLDNRTGHSKPNNNKAKNTQDTSTQNKQQPGDGIAGRACFALASRLQKRLLERPTSAYDPFAMVGESLLPDDLPELRVQGIETGHSTEFPDATIEAIRDYSLDVLIHTGFSVLDGKVLKAAQAGVWSLFFGEPGSKVCQPGFWDVMQSRGTSSLWLQQLNDVIGTGKVLRETVSMVELFSVVDTRSCLLWKGQSLIIRELQLLQRLGYSKWQAEKENLATKATDDSAQQATSSGGIVSGGTYLRLVTGKMIDKVVHVANRKRFRERWTLGYSRSGESLENYQDYHWLTPPGESQWADPHIVQHEGTDHIFIEEIPAGTSKGRIAHLCLDADGTPSDVQVIMDKDHHMSFPFVFCVNGEFFMIPETSSNRTLELYKSEEFPLQWTKVCNLMSDVQIVDTTLLFHADQWWMFCSKLDHPGAYIQDELSIFYAKDLCSTDWTPHPLNPVVSDAHCARASGAVFTENGKLYRPFQNIAHRYGNGVGFSEITKLSTTEYSEEVISSVVAPQFGRFVGIHSYAQTDSLRVLDAIERVSR